jgi:hypothetical protein
VTLACVELMCCELVQSFTLYLKCVDSSRFELIASMSEKRNFVKTSFKLEVFQAQVLKLAPGLG